MTDGYRVRLSLITGLLTMLAAAPAFGQSIWEGQGEDSLWSTDANWDTPPDPANTGSLTFTGDSNRGPVADEQTWTNITTLLFDDQASSFDISGETLEFDDGSIVNDSDVEQTIGNDIVATGGALTLTTGDQTLRLGGELDLDAGLTLDIDGTGVAELNDIVSGEGGIDLGSGASLTLSQANTYEGGTVIGPNSTLIIGDDESLGTGDLAVEGPGVAALEGEEDAGGLVIENAVTLDADAQLELGGDETLVLEGDVTGDGGLISDGTVILSGDNTYADGTELQSGILVALSETAFSSGSINVTGDASIGAGLEDDESIDARTIENDISIDADQALSFVGETSMILDGIISGDGGLAVDLTVQEEDEDEDQEEIDPVLTITEANTYTGGTELNSGTVELGHDQALSTGDVTVDGTIEITSDTDRVLSNDIIILGEDDGEDDNSRMNVTGEQDFDFNGSFDGSGELDLRLDDATATFGGNSEDFTGRTRAFDGTTVQIDGTLGGDLHSEAFVGGEGTITGELRNFSGGVVAPGNSMGTLEVEGDYDQLADSTLEVEINVGTGDSDTLLVGGNVQLADDSTIDVIREDSTELTVGDTFDIIEADGTITDDGVSIVDDSSETLLRLVGEITADSGTQIYQLVASSNVFGFNAEGGNNLAVASGLDSLNEPGASSEVEQFLSDIADISDVDEYNQTLEELSPEAYDAVNLVSIDNAHIYTSNVRDYLSARRRGGPIMAGIAISQASPIGASLDEPETDQRRLALMLDEQGGRADADGERQPRRIAGERVGRGGDRGGFGEDSDWGVFGQAVGGVHDTDSDTYRTGHEAQIFGGQFGVDRNISDQLTLGMGFSYLRSDVDLRNDRGEFDADSFRVGPYLGWTDSRNKWFVDTSLTWGYHEVDSERYVPEEDADATASFNAQEVMFYAGTGYPYDLGEFTLTPRATLQYLYFQQDGFSESGAGPANLNVHDRDAHSLRTRLGASLDRAFEAGGLVILPELFLGWEYEALGEDDITADFAAGSDGFSVTPASPGRSAAALGASVNVLFDENVSAFVRYEGRLSTDTETHGLGAGFSLRF